MALSSANNCCMGKKYKDLVAKTCHFVISDVIKNGTLGVCDITKGAELIAVCNKQIKVHLSCDISSHDESNLSVSDSEEDIHS